jgi:hypothetical protein
MAKEYGKRPSEILKGSVRDFALDCAVWEVAQQIEGKLHKADEKGREAIYAKLKRDADEPKRTAKAKGRRRAGHS